ncbi:MAG: TIGR01620 family protein, partial [Alphaproteobacteria bacterium]|nr:TIGR01620 family protein [Alphaproteobacteria bacterium]
MSRPDGPLLIEMDEPAAETPASAPTVPDLAVTYPQGQALQTLTVLAGRRGSRLWSWFWAATVGVVGLMISVAAWDFVFGLLARNVWLGRAALIGVGVVVLTALGLSLREW